MACEIEFLPVGKASKGGDAIIVRTGSPESYRVMIVDGGDADSGKAVVEHVKNTFGPNTIIADVVATHSDTDHISGLREIVAELNVKNVWIHQPWTVADIVRQYLQNKTWTVDGLAKQLRAEYDLVSEIVRIADERKIPVHQPFAGSQIGSFQVISPYQSIYPIFLAQFDRTPDPDVAAIKASGWWIGKGPTFMDRMVDKAASTVQKLIAESWENEKLKDGGCTSASNESSVVLYGDFGPGQKVLLTGDAGNWGLRMAVEFAKQRAMPLRDFTFVQIPHHGSRRNVGPTILNELIGAPLPPNSPSKFAAYVSAPADDDRHPRKMVLNAFLRRGGTVIATQGSKKVHWGGFPVRPNYTGVTGLPFAPQVEDYD